MITPAPKDTLLTRRETAAHLRISQSSVKRYAKHGLCPVRIGPRLIRYRLGDIEAFGNRAKSEPEK